MLLIGGQAPLRNLLRGGLQELNAVDIMKPITKFSGTVLETERIPEIVSIAIREAHNGRPGPSFLEIPQDVLDREVDDGHVSFPLRYRSKGCLVGERCLIDQAAELLRN